MLENFKTETYMALLGELGPEKSNIVLSNLAKDLEKVRNELSLARVNLENKALRAPTHVLISLAGVIGAFSMCELAKQINEIANSDTINFPDNKVMTVLEMLDGWLQFLASEVKTGS